MTKNSEKGALEGAVQAHCKSRALVSRNAKTLMFGVWPKEGEEWESKCSNLNPPKRENPDTTD